MSMLARQVAESLASASWIRRMFEEGHKLRAEFGAANVYDFSLGNPHLEPPAQVLEQLRHAAGSTAPGQHRYMQNPGYPEVRAKVAQSLGQREGVMIPPTHVLMTVGAACGLNVALRALLDPGDEVVLFAPAFAEYKFYIMHAGGICRLAQTDDTFDLDPVALEAVLSPRTRVVLVNSPNNPTGRVYPLTSLQKVAAVLTQARQRFGRPIVLLSDEPYRRLVYDAVVPPLFSLYPHSLIVSSFSKDLGLAGERIGYLAVHPQFPDMPRVMAGLEFCLRTLGFVNAPALWQRVAAESLDAAVDIAAYRHNRDLLWNGLTTAGYECIKPEGAFFLFPKSPLADDKEFIFRLQAERIVAVPGMAFDRPGYFRLSYALPPEVITAALPGFAKVRAACVS